MIRLQGAELEGEEERDDGWIGGEGGGVSTRQVTDGVCFSEACTCAGGRFLWVLHKGAMCLLRPGADCRTHKLS